MTHSEVNQICNEHINRYVFIQMNDGTGIDGIIERIEGDHVLIAVPIAAEHDQRAFFGYGFPGFGFPFFRPRFRPFWFPFWRFGGLYPMPFYW